MLRVGQTSDQSDTSFGGRAGTPHCGDTGGVTLFRRRDALSAAVTVALGILLIALGVAGLDSPPLLPGWDAEQSSRWWHLVPLAVGGIAMLFERKRPLLSFAVGTAALLGDFAIGGSLAVLLVWWDLLYAVGLHASTRARNIITAVMVTGTLAVATAAAEHDRDFASFLLVALQVGAVVLVPLWWAWGVRQGHELAAVASERARLEAERATTLSRLAELDRAEAVAAERSAMARELHDVISSHLSAIAIHSAAALAAPADRDRDRAALGQVRAASLASLEEMRTMITLLRSDTTAEPLTTGDGLSALPELVAWAGDAGLSVTVTNRGDHNSVLPTAVDQSALRIIREALTNALKYGTGTASLAIVADGTAVTITVDNRIPTVATPATGGGTGLVSMQERAVSLGGTFSAGEHAGRWTVQARLPASRAALR